MFDGRKNTIITCLAVVSLSCIIAIIFLITSKPDPVPYDQTLIDTRIDALESENDQLKKDIQFEKERNAKILKQIDYLESLPPKIEIRYETKYKTIDNSSVSVVVAEFDSIFTNNGIK